MLFYGHASTDLCGFCEHARRLSQDTSTARDIFKFEKVFPRDMRISFKETFADGKCTVGKLRAHAFTRNLNNFLGMCCGSISTQHSAWQVTQVVPIARKFSFISTHCAPFSGF